MLSTIEESDCPSLIQIIRRYPLRVIIDLGVVEKFATTCLDAP